MQHHLRPRRLLLGLALSLAVTGAAACGDDDDEAGADTDTTDQLGGEAAMPAEACDAYVGLSGAMAGDPSAAGDVIDAFVRSEEHTSELQSLMRISYAVFCLQKKK